MIVIIVGSFTGQKDEGQRENNVYNRESDLTKNRDYKKIISKVVGSLRSNSQRGSHLERWREPGK